MQTIAYNYFITLITHCLSLVLQERGEEADPPSVQYFICDLTIDCTFICTTFNHCLSIGPVGSVSFI